MCVGNSGDTPAFAADAIADRWQAEGATIWPDSGTPWCWPTRVAATALARSRLWKQRVQTQICDRFGPTVTVCHYPTGCSKSNPIENKLFSHISQNWAGVPLRSWETILAFIRGTKP